MQVKPKHRSSKICDFFKEVFMRIFMLILAPFLLLSAREYYAKVEPYEIRSIASNVSGQVLFADETLQGKRLTSKPFVVIDDELDVIELESLDSKLQLLQQTLELNEQLKRNYEETLRRKNDNYERIKDLKIKSSVEKDSVFYDLIAAQNALIGIDKEIVSLKTQINDLKLRQSQLERSVRDKHISAKGMVLYTLNVKEGQVVAAGSVLAKVADVSKALLTLYLTQEDASAAREKVLYLNGKKSEYRISRVWDIADEQHLSSYRAEIVIDAPERFSSLVKVELRDE